MNKIIIKLFLLILVTSNSLAENLKTTADDLFYIGQMNSHDKNFTLFIWNNLGNFSHSFYDSCKHSSFLK